MPLAMSERNAVDLALLRIQAQDGSLAGVQYYLRGLGAHSEQAKRLASEAMDAYVEIEEFRELLEPEVSATVEVNGRELEVTLKADRLPITSYQELVDFYEIDTEVWHPKSQLFNFWGSKENPNFQVKAAFVKDEYQSAKLEDREEFLRWAASAAPSWEDGSPGREAGSLLLEVVLSDLHVERYVRGGLSLKEYLGEVTRAFQRVIWDAAPKSENIREVHVVLLGDTFNSDSWRGTTTKGTPQENVSDYQTVFTQTREAIAWMALFATSLGADVTLHIIPGNHDRERSYYLSDSLAAYFSKHEGIIVAPADGSRQYITWGSTLIGLAHGDDIKPMDLVMSMFREADTSGVRYFAWHLGHIHTRREEEVHGVLIRHFRTAQAPSSWEEAKGYGHNGRDVVGILHHVSEGDVAEFRAPLEVAYE